MKKVLFFFFIFLLYKDVFANEVIKPKKFRHCKNEYYDLSHICSNELKKYYESIGYDIKDTSDCGQTHFIVKYRSLYDHANEWNKFGDERQCFRDSPRDKNDNGYQIKCKDAVRGTQGIGDYNISTCDNIFSFIELSNIEKLQSQKAFLNKKEQKKFCKHLKECSAIIEEVLRQEGRIE